MTINMGISENSIDAAANQLDAILSNISDGIDETIEILTNEGREIAQFYDGDMAVVTSSRPDKMTGVIEASGTSAIIAEFGAGDDTMIGIPFDNPPPVDVYPGSYSEQVGTQEYFATGKWHFGGNVYTAVAPRQGLYHAKEHTINTASTVAQGAIHL